MSTLDDVNVILHSRPSIHRPYTTAIILASGLGSRMNNKNPKQFEILMGKPVLVHSLLAFQNCTSITEIVVVTRSEYLEKVKNYISLYEIKKCTCVVPGGETRQESAKCGLQAVSDKTTYVAIHDAARCLITPKQISLICRAAYAYKAACPGEKVTSTVKRVTKEGFIDTNIPREEVYSVSTPQIFDRNYYILADKYASDKHAIVTDDTSLMEYIGQRVKIVDIGHENLKITYPEDLLTAEFILKKRLEKKK